MERGRDKFKRYKKCINALVAVFSVFSKKTNERLLVHYRKTTGNFGLVLRYAILKNIAGSVGDNVSIHPDVYIINPGKLSIGNNVSIHPMSYIQAYGGVTIGDDVSIAHGTSIVSHNHKFTDADVPIKDQGLDAAPIVIRDNVWIGSKVTILGNTVIDSGTIIGAGSVVTKNIGCNSVAVGVPARVIKDRIK